MPKLKEILGMIVIIAVVLGTVTGVLFGMFAARDYHITSSHNTPDKVWVNDRWVPKGSNATIYLTAGSKIKVKIMEAFGEATELQYKIVTEDNKPAIVRCSKVFLIALEEGE